MEVKAPSTSLFGWLSVGYLAFAAFGAWALGYFDPGGTPISPNEWGDVLAGVFSPLAFLWLIYAALSQRAELALQRAELTQNNATQDAQREEMRKQGEALSAQAKLLEAQANGRYEPALVVTLTHTSEVDGGAVLVNLRNENAGISNVEFSGNAKPTSAKVANAAPSRQLQGQVMGYWPAGGSVTLTLNHDGLPLDGPQFDMQFDRADGARCARTYRLRDRATRIEKLPSVSHLGGS